MTENRSAPWRVHSSRTLLENPWFAVTSRDVELPDGTHIDFQSVVFPRPSVAVVARRNQELLLIRQQQTDQDQQTTATQHGNGSRAVCCQARHHRANVSNTVATRSRSRAMVRSMSSSSR